MLALLAAAAPARADSLTGKLADAKRIELYTKIENLFDQTLRTRLHWTGAMGGRRSSLQVLTNRTSRGSELGAERDGHGLAARSVR
jgi:hypothetical protein